MLPPLLRLALLLFPILALTGCATIRVTDPTETADQLFLQSEATRLAVARINADQLRDRKVFVDTTYLAVFHQTTTDLAYREIPQPFLFLIAELRAKLLLSGARMVDKREDADIIVEARSGGVSVNREDYLLGLSSITVPTEVVASIPFQTPQISILQSTKQYGFASVAIVAYWRDTGDIVSSSGPFVGRTARKDYWIFGFALTPVGNIPPTQNPPPETK
jgi:hypothetical protein